jgi:hypothetical protein
VTVIADGQEQLVPIRVAAVPVGPQTIGAGGGLVKGSDGAQVEIAPGALSASATVQIAPVSLSSLPEGAPSGFHFIGAEKLDLGGQGLAIPADLTVAGPAGTSVGTEVYAYLATTLPDETGSEVPVWQEVDVGYVGADGLARTGVPPYQGILSEGTYAFALADDPTQVTQVQVTLDPSSFAGAIGARYALVDPFGFDPLVSILSEGAFTLSSFTFTLDMKFGPDPVQIEALPLTGVPSFTSVQLDIEPGSTNFTEAIMPLPDNDVAPEVDAVRLNLSSTQAPQLVLTGTEFGSNVTRLQVYFQMVGGANVPDPAKGTDLQLNGNQLTVTVPQSITLGLSQVIVRKTIVDDSGNILDVLDSYPTPIEATGGYLFTALPGLPGNGEVAVVDTRATIPQGTGSVANPDLNELVATVPLASGASNPYPQYVAVTADGTRAYVTDPVNHGVAVIDAVALQQVNAVPGQPGVNEIPLPASAAPGDITIAPEDEYAYVSDERSQNEGTPDGTSLVYVIDIDPSSPTYNQLVRTIPVPQAPFGLHGLAVNSDDTGLYVAVPNMLDSEHAAMVPRNTPGHIQVIDLTPDATGQPAWKLLTSITAGNDPYGVTAGPDDIITFTDYLFNDQSFGLITKGSTTATFAQFNFQANLNDEFEVNNARAIAITPDGKYAFVAGYDIPDDSVSSHNQGVPAFNPAGSKIGIVANPFTDPQLVAATRSIPDGFPYDLAVSPDGRYLYASFAGIHVAGGSGALMVYDINQIIDTIAAQQTTDVDLLAEQGEASGSGENPQNTDVDLLERVGIDQINPAIDADANYQLPPSVTYSPGLIDSYAPSFVTEQPTVAATATNTGNGLGGYSTAFNITNPGRGYPIYKAPAVVLTGAGGSGATAHAVVTPNADDDQATGPDGDDATGVDADNDETGSVTGIVLDSPGSGYTSYGVEITYGGPPIATGGVPHGMAVQPNLLEVTEDPPPGGLIQVNLPALLTQADPALANPTNFWLDINSVRGGDVALTQDEYTALATGKPTPTQQQDISNGLPLTEALEPKQSDILTVRPPAPGQRLTGVAPTFANTGLFYVTAYPQTLPYNSSTGTVLGHTYSYPANGEPITGDFYFSTGNGVESAEFVIDIGFPKNDPARTPSHVLGNSLPTNPSQPSPNLSKIDGSKFTDSKTAMSHEYFMSPTGYQIGGTNSAGLTFSTGQAFTARQEGLGLDPYVPQGGTASGITIGFGYDVGVHQTEPTTVASYLWQAGINWAQANAYVTYLGAEQQNEVDNDDRTAFSNTYLAQFQIHPDLQSLYVPQAVALYYELYQYYVSQTINKIGQTVWNNLMASSPNVLDVLVDIYYNLGNLPTPIVNAAQSNTPTSSLLTYLEGIYNAGLSDLQSNLADLQSTLADLQAQPPTAALAKQIAQTQKLIHAANKQITTYTTTGRRAQRIIHLGGTPAGQAQLVSGEGSIPAAGPPLTEAQLQPIVAQVINAWTTVGATPAQVRALRTATYQIGALPSAEVGSTTGSVVTLSPDAASAGWFVDPMPADNLEFTQPVAPTEFDATPGSPAFGKVDLLTVVEHEMGHVLGLPDVANSAEPNDVMDLSLAPGVRRLAQVSDLEQLTAAPAQRTPPAQPTTPAAQPAPATTNGQFAPVTWAASVLPAVPGGDTGTKPGSAQLQQLASTPAPTTSLVNGGFDQGSDNLQGWVVSDPNQVTVNAQHQAVITESRSAIEVDLSQDFLIPTTAKTLTFTLDGSTNDSHVGSGVTPDAFGVALLDPRTLQPLGSVVDGVTDSYYIQDLAPRVSGGMTGSLVSVSAPNAGAARNVAVNVAGLGGQSVRLLFRFIAGSDASQLGGSVTVSDVTLGDAPLPPPNGAPPPNPVPANPPPSNQPPSTHSPSGGGNTLTGTSPGGSSATSGGGESATTSGGEASAVASTGEGSAVASGGGGSATASTGGENGGVTGGLTAAAESSLVTTLTIGEGPGAARAGETFTLLTTTVTAASAAAPGASSTFSEGSPELTATQSTPGVRAVSDEVRSWVSSHTEEVDDFWPWLTAPATPADRPAPPRQEDADTFWPWQQGPASDGGLGRVAPARLDALFAARQDADGRVVVAGEEAGRAAAEALAVAAEQMTRERGACDALFARPGEEGRVSTPARDPVAAEPPLPAGRAAPPAGFGPALAGLVAGLWHALTAPLRRQEGRRRRGRP